MSFRVHPGEMTISETARRSRDKIFDMFPNKRVRTLRTVHRVSLFRYHFPTINSHQHKPLDVIQVDFISNIYHLYTAGANINSGVPHQGFILIRTVFETLLKDMRLLSLYENQEEDFESMYSWIIERDGLGYDRELQTWGFARNRDYLFEGEVRIRVRDFYGKLSKLVHGSSRLIMTNIELTKEIVKSAWDHLYWIAHNALLIMIYAHREYLPIDELYQGYIIDITNDFGFPEDFLLTNKLPDLNFKWLEEHLKV